MILTMIIYKLKLTLLTFNTTRFVTRQNTRAVNMGDEDCILFARLGVRDGQLKTGVQADQDAAFSLAQAAAEELK